MRTFVESLEDRLAPAIIVYSVDNSNDTGPGSLRQALLEANAHANNSATEPDIIEFNLPANDPGHVYYRNDNAPGVSTANISTTTATDDAQIADIDPDWNHSWWQIIPLQVSGPLPDITEGVIIDGYSQTGASANTLAIGDDAVLRIELVGSAVTSTATAFTLSNTGGTGSSGSSGTILTGLAINRFNYAGIAFYRASSNTIAGNFIGTDVSGTIALGNGQFGVGSYSGAKTHSNNVIGGSNPADRNVIVGLTTGIGIHLFQSFGETVDSNVIQGNYIGLNAAGTARLGTFDTGVRIGSATNTLVGGSEPGMGNVISSSATDLEISSATNIHVYGNFVGTDATGMHAVTHPNSETGVGVLITNVSPDVFIGGGNPGEGNVISGHHQFGIQLGLGVTVASASGVVIQGNKIGVAADGTTALGNQRDGLYLRSGSGHLIGGTEAGQGNIIANNGFGTLLGPNYDGVGVKVFDGVSYTFLGNSIYGNKTLGINLEGGIETITTPSGTTFTRVTQNDTGDADTGVNNLQNFPELTSAVAHPTNMRIQGTLNSTPNQTYRVELFANTSGDSTGYGEGKTYLGFTDVTTDSSGDSFFDVTVPYVTANGLFITSTATDPSGNTSEFSHTVVATFASSPVDLLASLLDRIQTELGSGGILQNSDLLQSINDTTLPLTQRGLADALHLSEQTVTIDRGNIDTISNLLSFHSNNVTILFKATDEVIRTWLETGTSAQFEDLMRVQVNLGTHTVDSDSDLPGDLQHTLPPGWGGSVDLENSSIGGQFVFGFDTTTASFYLQAKADAKNDTITQLTATSTSTVTLFNDDLFPDFLALNNAEFSASSTATISFSATVGADGKLRTGDYGNLSEVVATYPTQVFDNPSLDLEGTFSLPFLKDDDGHDSELHLVGSLEDKLNPAGKHIFYIHLVGDLPSANLAGFKLHNFHFDISFDDAKGFHFGKVDGALQLPHELDGLAPIGVGAGAAAVIAAKHLPVTAELLPDTFDLSKYTLPLPGFKLGNIIKFDGGSLVNSLKVNLVDLSVSGQVGIDHANGTIFPASSLNFTFKDFGATFYQKGVQLTAGSFEAKLKDIVALKFDDVFLDFTVPSGPFSSDDDIFTAQAIHAKLPKLDDLAFDLTGGIGLRRDGALHFLEPNAQLNITLPDLSQVHPIFRVLPMEVQEVGLIFHNQNSLEDFDLRLKGKIKDSVFDSLPFKPTFHIGPGDAPNSFDATLNLEALRTEHPELAFEDLGPIHVGFESKDLGKVKITGDLKLDGYVDGELQHGVHASFSFGGEIGDLTGAKTTITADGTIVTDDETGESQIDLDGIFQVSFNIRDGLIDVKNAGLKFHWRLQNTPDADGKPVMSSSVSLASDGPDLSVENVKVKIGDFATLEAGGDIDFGAEGGEPMVRFEHISMKFGSQFPKLKDWSGSAEHFAISKDGALLFEPNFKFNLNIPKVQELLKFLHMTVTRAAFFAQDGFFKPGPENVSREIDDASKFAIELDGTIDFQIGTLEGSGLVLDVGKYVHGEFPIPQVRGAGFHLKPLTIPPVTIGGGVAFGHTAAGNGYVQVDATVGLAKTFEVGGNLVIGENGIIGFQVTVPTPIPFGPTGLILTTVTGGLAIGVPPPTFTSAEDLHPGDIPDVPNNLANIEQAVDNAVLHSATWEGPYTFVLKGKLIHVLAPGVFSADVSAALNTAGVVGSQGTINVYGIPFGGAVQVLDFTTRDVKVLGKYEVPFEGDLLSFLLPARGELDYTLDTTGFIQGLIIAERDLIKKAIAPGFKGGFAVAASFMSQVFADLAQSLIDDTTNPLRLLIEQKCRALTSNDNVQSVLGLIRDLVSLSNLDDAISGGTELLKQLIRKVTRTAVSGIAIGLGATPDATGKLWQDVKDLIGAGQDEIVALIANLRDAGIQAVQEFEHQFNPRLEINGLMQPLVLGVPLGPPDAELGVAIDKNSLSIHTQLSPSAIFNDGLKGIPGLGQVIGGLEFITGAGFLFGNENLSVDVRLPFPGLFASLARGEFPEINPFSGPWSVSISGALQPGGIEIAEVTGGIFAPGNDDLFQVIDILSGDFAAADVDLIGVSSEVRKQLLVDQGGIILNASFRLPAFLVDPIARLKDIPPIPQDDPLSLAGWLLDLPDAVKALQEVGRLQLYLPSAASVMGLVAATVLDSAGHEIQSFVLKPSASLQELIDRYLANQTDANKSALLSPLQALIETSYVEGALNLDLLGLQLADAVIDGRSTGLHVTGDIPWLGNLHVGLDISGANYTAANGTVVGLPKIGADAHFDDQPAIDALQAALDQWTQIPGLNIPRPDFPISSGGFDFRAYSPGFDPSAVRPDPTNPTHNIADILKRRGGVELGAHLDVPGLVDDAEFDVQVILPTTIGGLPDFKLHTHLSSLGLFPEVTGLQTFKNVDLTIAKDGQGFFAHVAGTLKLLNLELSVDGTLRFTNGAWEGDLNLGAQNAVGDLFSLDGNVSLRFGADGVQVHVDGTMQFNNPINLAPGAPNPVLSGSFTFTAQADGTVSVTVTATAPIGPFADVKVTQGTLVITPSIVNNLPHFEIVAELAVQVGVAVPSPTNGLPTFTPTGLFGKGNVYEIRGDFLLKIDTAHSTFSLEVTNAKLKLGPFELCGTIGLSLQRADSLGVTVDAATTVGLFGAVRGAGTFTITRTEGPLPGFVLFTYDASLDNLSQGAITQSRVDSSSVEMAEDCFFTPGAFGLPGFASIGGIFKLKFQNVGNPTYLLEVTDGSLDLIGLPTGPLTVGKLTVGVDHGTFLLTVPSNAPLHMSRFNGIVTADISGTIRTPDEYDLHGEGNLHVAILDPDFLNIGPAAQLDGQLLIDLTNANGFEASFLGDVALAGFPVAAVNSKIDCDWQMAVTVEFFGITKNLYIDLKKGFTQDIFDPNNIIPHLCDDDTVTDAAVWIAADRSSMIEPANGTSSPVSFRIGVSGLDATDARQINLNYLVLPQAPNQASSSQDYVILKTLRDSVSVVKDTTLDSANPPTNLGASTTLTVQRDAFGTSEKFALLQFNLPDPLAGALIGRSYLSVVHTFQPGDSTNASLELYRVNETWIEKTTGRVTYNSFFQDDSTPPATALGLLSTRFFDFELGTERFVWDVTDLVREWFNDPTSNFGVMVRVAAGTTGQVTLVAQEALVAAMTPTLTVSRFDAAAGPQPALRSVTLSSAQPVVELGIAIKGDIFNERDEQFVVNVTPTGPRPPNVQVEGVSFPFTIKFDTDLPDGTLVAYQFDQEPDPPDGSYTFTRDWTFLDDEAIPGLTASQISFSEQLLANRAVRFSASSQTVTATANNLPLPTTNWTAELWLRPSQNPASGAVNILKMGGSNQFSITRSSTGAVAFSMQTNQRTITGNLGNVPLGIWHHVAVVRNGNTIQTVFDGVAINTVTFNTGETFSFSNNAITLGGGLIGLIDEFRLWNTSRTTTQINSAKNGVVPPQLQLELYYRFDEQPNPVTGNSPGTTVDLSLRGRPGTFQSATYFNSDAPLNYPNHGLADADPGLARRNAEFPLGTFSNAAISDGWIDAINDPLSMSANLLQNADPASTGLQFWQGSPGWTVGSTNSVQGNYFQPPNVPQAKLFQEVNVSAYAMSIDGGQQRFLLSAFVRSSTSNLPSVAQITIEYLDQSRTVLAGNTINGATAPANWRQALSDQPAPAGTRFIRVTIISNRSSAPGATNSALFDGLTLVAVQPANYLEFQVTIPDRTGPFDPQPSVTLGFLDFWELAEAGGPTRWELRSSLDNFAASLARGTTTTADYLHHKLVPLNMGTIVGPKTVIFRLYAYGGNSGRWKVDNLAIVQSRPVPPPIPVTAPIPPTNPPGTIPVAPGPGGLQGFPVTINPRHEIVIGAIAYFDANHNGKLDFNDHNSDGFPDPDEWLEPATVTDDRGEAILFVPESFDTNHNGLLEPSEGDLRTMGGVLASTGLPVLLPFEAPLDATVVSPLTTLLLEIQRQQGSTRDQAATLLARGLGLPDVNVLFFDHVAETSAGNVDGAKVAKAIAVVYSAQVQLATILQATLGGSLTLAGQGALKLLAKAIAAAPSAINLADPTTFLALLKTSTQAGIGKIRKSIQKRAAQSIATALQPLTTLNASPSIDFLVQLEQTEVQAQQVNFTVKKPKHEHGKASKSIRARRG